MIIRNAHGLAPLEVHDLNKIVVLIDRSETALTEVGLNTWPAGIKGPSHAHLGKEQIFLILSGKGKVIASGNSFSVESGDIIYVPPGVEHQTIVDSVEPLTYFLFNAFLNENKEGHGSFADHIAKVRDTRKAQAEGRTSSGALPQTEKSPATAKLEHDAIPSDGTISAKIALSGSLTVRSEVIAVTCGPQSKNDITDDPSREQVLYILDGRGALRIENESESRQITAGDAVYVPAGTSLKVVAGSQPLRYVGFRTRIGSAD